MMSYGQAGGDMTQVRMAVVQKLAAMKAKMGAEEFKKAAQGRLTRE